MKIKMLDKRKMIIFFKTVNFDFNNIEKLEEELRNLFSKLNYLYKIEVRGFYYVKAYLDKYSGVVLELDGEDLVLDYLEGEIDMRIEVLERTFLYEVKDILDINKKLLNKFEIYKHNNLFILKPKKNLSYIEIGEILEYSKLIYKNKNPYLLTNKNKIN